jgi:hypothetical protein
VDWRCSFSCIWRSSGTLSENLQVRHRPCLKRVNDGGMLKISTQKRFLLPKGVEALRAVGLIKVKGSDAEGSSTLKNRRVG